MMDIAAEIRADLARQQITWRQLALATDLPQSTVHRRLKTNQDWRLDELARICRHLDIRLVDLLSRAEREQGAA